MLAGLILVGSPAFANGQSPLNAFPEAQPGKIRYVVELAHKERREEQNYQVELVIGRMMETDGVNQVMLAGSIEPQPLKGWGYTYYESSGSLMMISTLMGVSPDQPQVKKFVHTAPLSIRYNSRLPIVVYVPEGYEVRYRIWSAAEDFQAAGQG